MVINCICAQIYVYTYKIFKKFWNRLTAETTIFENLNFKQENVLPKHECIYGYRVWQFMTEI